MHRFSKPAAAKGLEGAFISVVVTFNGETVGMGRVIGDGGCFFQMVDIVIDEKHRGRGLGKKIVAKLLELLRDSASESAYVSLIADVPADELYERFGFTSTAPKSIAMALTV